MTVLEINALKFVMNMQINLVLQVQKLQGESN